jgi:hypothetical protein
MNAQAPGSRREDRVRALPRPLSIGLGVVMAILFAYALWQAVPDREAVALEQRGAEALVTANYGEAENDFVAVLRREPASTDARLGLACSYYLTGKRSAATLELTLGLKAGLVPGHIGQCGHGLHFDEVFLAAKLGLNESFAVPRVKEAGQFEEALDGEPVGTSTEEPQRMLTGSCLAFRAGLDGAAWIYAASAVETHRVEKDDERQFFSCLGTQLLERLHCARRPSLRWCVLTDRARAAYLRDRPYLYPATSPAAFVDAQ